MTKTGTGTLTLTGNNTFTGPLRLDEGILVLGHDSAAGLGTFTLANNVTVAATNGARTIANNLTLNGNVTFAGPDNLTFLDSFSLGGDRTFTVLNTTIFNGVISGGGYSLFKEGSGTLVLNGANTFGGSSDSLSVNNGTVAFGNNSAAGRSANILLLNGGSVQASGAARTLVNPVRIANNSSIAGSQNLTFSGSVMQPGRQPYPLRQ